MLEFKSVLQDVFDLNSNKCCIRTTASPASLVLITQRNTNDALAIYVGLYVLAGSLLDNYKDGLAVNINK